MRCTTLCLTALTALLCCAFAPDQEPVTPAATQTESPYAGAEACKACHAAIFERWARTGHERAFKRMSAADQQKTECLTCHVTGTRDEIAAELDNASHPGVQCECCHGPGRQHAARAATAPPALEGMTPHPGEQVCLRCHNDKSPRFRGFVFQAMVKLVHQ